MLIVNNKKKLNIHGHKLLLIQMHRAQLFNVVRWGGGENMSRQTVDPILVSWKRLLIFA